MSVVVPAVLAKDRRALEETLARLMHVPHVRAVQLDAVDGTYAAPKNWPYTEGATALKKMAEQGEQLPGLGHFTFEADLMVADPERVLSDWIAVGATRITLHAESTSYLPRIIAEIRHRHGHAKGFAPELLSLGLATGIATDLALVEPYVDDIDYVQFMGIRSIGKQGEPFDAAVLRKVAQFHKRYPHTPIQVDGGVSLKTAPALLAAGVSRLIVGSALLTAPNLLEEYGKFEDLAARYGGYER